MITERDLVLALPTIIISVVTVSIAAWLWYALTRPQKNVRIAVILNGLAVISFLIGESISVGPNPKHDYGGFKNVRTINSGPAWGVIIGLTLAIILMLIAHYLAKKRS